VTALAVHNADIAVGDSLGRIHVFQAEEYLFEYSIIRPARPRWPRLGGGAENYQLFGATAKTGSAIERKAAQGQALHFEGPICAFYNSVPVSELEQKWQKHRGRCQGLVLVSGSAEDGRIYTPAMNDPAGARKAAELVGAALTKAGCRIAVFSAEIRFIEHAAVKGFVGALKAKAKKDRAGRIEVRAPLAAQTAFAEQVQFDDIFVDLVDQEAGWRRALSVN
jgi:hypothetical protein